MIDIRQIFETNKSLIGEVDRAIAYFRIGRYDKALEWVADTADEIHFVADGVMENREYFDSISTDYINEMLQNILDATQNKDYVLLADLYDMQLATFICGVQEHILKREQYLLFDNDEYRENINSLKTVLREMIEERDDLTVDEQKRFRVNLNAKLDDIFDPSALLNKGFNLEFTSSGLMTIAAPFGGGRIYLHSNGRVVNESIQLALSWFDPIVDEYIVYGFGMGYHIEELNCLAPDKRIVIYESDLDVLRLYCAFSDGAEILSKENIFVVYDRDMSVLQRRIGSVSTMNEDGKFVFVGQDGKIVKVCVHYPSYRRSPGCPAIDAALPWKRIVESC
ncbi:MAG: hypothetical protein IKP88_07645 [Lachnospiraceae bacterium]|nr:hypothetical protein [Lachnospiraceae bacterium]